MGQLNRATKKNNNNVKTNRSLIASAVASTFFITTTGFAQQESTNTSEIEVVTVNAQKRVQNILKVPVTVGTISEKLIKESGSVLLSEVDKFIPGFDFSDSNMTQAGITMRGISSPNISVGGDPSTATFYDDVYMPRAAQNVLFSDMERIEVLKGPQGTLFGRNAAMGVVNMVPKSPRDENEGFVKATLGTDNLQKIEGMTNVTLGESVYLRANILDVSQDGVVKNVAEPDWNNNHKIWDLGEQNHRAARVSLLWGISSATSFQIAYDWDDLEQGPPMAIGVSEYAYSQGKTPFSSKAENDVRNGIEARDMYGVTAKLKHEFDQHWSMKYVMAYRDWETENRQDEDGTGDHTRYFDTSNNEDSDIFYNELQVNYVSDNVNAVAGFSYSKEKVHQTTELNMTTDTAARLVTGEVNSFIKGGVAEELVSMIGGNTDAHAEAAFGSGVTFAGAVNSLYTLSGFPMSHIWNTNEWSGALNALGFADDIMAAIGMAGMPLTPEVVALTGDVTYDIVAMQLGFPEIFGPGLAGQFWEETVNNTGDFTNWGVFADVDYQINNKWNIIAGLRYSKDKKDFTWLIPQNSFNTVRPGVGNLVFPNVDLAASDEWDKVTGRLVSSYQIDDDQMIFASYSTGYKSGGFDSLAPSSSAFAPEDTTNMEVGYKAVLGGSFIANLSAYYLELDNLQRSIDSKAPDSSQAIPTIINEDRKIKGFEADLRWKISDSVQLGMVTEIRSTENSSPDFYNGEGDLVAATKTSSKAAKNYTFIFNWMPDLGTGHTNIHVDYVFRENTNKDIAGLESYKLAVDEYFEDEELLNARVSWSDASDTYEVGLWGKNLLDNRYMLSIGGLTANVLGTPQGRINRGLEAGIDFKYSF